MSSDATTRLIEVVQDPGLRAGLESGFGDYCHQSRNRLNSLKLSIYLAKRQVAGALSPAWAELEANYHSLEAQIDRLQSVCRPLSLAPVSLPLRLLFDDRSPAWSRALAGRGRTLILDAPTGADVARFDVAQLGAALDLLLDWRADRGSSGTPITIGWRVRAGRASVTWAEPSPASSGSPRAADDDLAWSLAILSRVVTEHQGVLRLNTEGGWGLTIDWPS